MDSYKIDRIIKNAQLIGTAIEHSDSGWFWYELSKIFKNDGSFTWTVYHVPYHSGGKCVAFSSTDLASVASFLSTDSVKEVSP